MVKDKDEMVVILNPRKTGLNPEFYAKLAFSTTIIMKLARKLNVKTGKRDLRGLALILAVASYKPRELEQDWEKLVPKRYRDPRYLEVAKVLRGKPRLGKRKSLLNSPKRYLGSSRGLKSLRT